MAKDAPENSGPKNLSPVSLGLNIATGIVVFSLGGFFLDKKYNSAPAWTMAGVLLGLVYAGYEVWKIVRPVEEEERRKRKK